MKPTRYHVSQSVRGAILFWHKSTWEAIAKDNKMSVHDIKNEFLDYVAEGKKVIPMFGECEGFSYETGCPGHPVEEE